MKIRRKFKLLSEDALTHVEISSDPLKSSLQHRKVNLVAQYNWTRNTSRWNPGLIPLLSHGVPSGFNEPWFCLFVTQQPPHPRNDEEEYSALVTSSLNQPAIWISRKQEVRMRPVYTAAERTTRIKHKTGNTLCTTWLFRQRLSEVDGSEHQYFVINSVRARTVEDDNASYYQNPRSSSSCI